MIQQVSKHMMKTSKHNSIWTNDFVFKIRQPSNADHRSLDTQAG